MKEVPLIGYTDKLSLRAGETISFKVSSTSNKPYTTHLFRSISADPNPQGLGIVEKSLEKFYKSQTIQPKYQKFYPGSYAITEEKIKIENNKSWRLSVIIFPTLTTNHKQSILSIGNLSLYINDNNQVTIEFSKDQNFLINEKIELKKWYHLEISYDNLLKKIQLNQKQLSDNLAITQKKTKFQFDFNNNYTFENKVVIAANQNTSGRVVNFFNGKIESPKIYIDNNKLMANWDFSIDISSTEVKDISSNNLKTKLINFPTRGVTGSHWNATEMCWKHAPDQYAAIHFHEDDIYDFEWKTDFTFTLPEEMPSGIYVMRLDDGTYQDNMPFFVCSQHSKPTAKICILISTFTYVIYGNHARPDYDDNWLKKTKNWNSYPYNPAEYIDYGLSTYNYHKDGYGICHASHRRPLFNLRSGYITFGQTECSGLRHFQADSHLISWLHEKDIAYDIITDNELHQEGLASIKNYDIVMTGSHPEYHTQETLDTLLSYRNNGGNFIYLGGNGFYWKIAVNKKNNNILEIRRAETGIRAWAAEPGEYYNAFDGSYGGLWRRSNRAPQKLCGVGFSAQGEFNGTYYVRHNYEKEFNWFFNKVNDKRIGDFGFSGFGAAGFELDRVDYHLGSPKNIVILATSATMREEFMLIPEEQLTHLTNCTGKPNKDLLKADMVYFELPNGGSVFSTGSITFCGSLPYNKFNNNVSQILSNVIEKMLSKKSS